MNENKQTSEQEVNQNKGEQEPEEKVELTTTQYNALLNKIDELETPRELDELDDLASEGLQADQADQQASDQKLKDYDNMTNQQLAVSIQQEMDANVVGPLRVAMETLSLKLEISELTKQEEYKDFWDHQEKIGPIAKANPNLSLKQCYDLAVPKGTEKPAPKEETSTRDQVLRHLPDPKQVHSEKPGAPASTTTEGDPEDLKGAANKAFDEVFGDKK